MALLLSLKRTVNLEPGLTAPQVFHVSQNDVGTKLYVGLEQGGTAYTIPENTTAKVQGCNALGEPFEAITATVSTNEVYFTITDQDVTQFAGNAKCEVVLTNGTNILGTANFIVAVEASPMGSDVPAIYTNPVQAYIGGVVQDYVDDDVLPDVTTAINGKVDIAQGSENAGKALVVNSSGNVEPGDIAIDIDDTLTQQGEAADANATGDALALKANASTVAPEFSDQNNYTAGSCVYKNGVLYRFTADHSGAWTGSDAVETTVETEIKRESATDEQVQNAVDNWLNEHPETTTTVQDGSLTEAKFSDELKLKTIKDYVTPEMFGAVGDGVTDDTEAIRNAVIYGRDNNLAVFIPQKTYVITHDSNTVTLLDGQSVVIFGAGQNSIIKRKDDSLVGKWNRLFVFQPGACESSHANDVILSNFCIDSNRRNQSNATSGYEYEAAADVAIQNGTGLNDPSYQYIDRVIVDNMRFYDPVADCFNFSGSGQVYVKNVWLNNMVATNRNGTRNDIGFTGNPLGDVWINNCKVSSIHFEFNATVNDDDIVTFHFNGVNTGSLSLGGRIDAILTNVYSNQLLLSDYRHIIIDGCIFDLKHSNNYMYNRNNPNNQLDICNSLIINKYISSNTIFRLYFRELSNVTFKSCTFDVVGDNDTDLDGDGVNDHTIANAISVESFVNSTITIDSCTASPRFRALIAIVSGAVYNINNMEINTGLGWTFGVLSSTGAFTDITINLNNVSLGDKCTKSFIVNTFNGSPVFKFNGTLKCKESNFLYSFDTSTAGSNFITALTGTFKRKLELSGPLDFAKLKALHKYTDNAKHNYNLFKSDEFDYVSESTPCKWIAKNTGTTTTNTVDGITGTQVSLSKRFKTIGSACGDTASRPVCILDRGFLYFDTDLNKNIMWNGTTWVNTDGSALS